MKFTTMIFAIGVLFSSCFRSEWKSAVAEDEMIEYKLKPGQYAVVIVLDNQVTVDQAKKAARHRAAEITVNGGYRYFLIQSETQTKVVKQTAKLDLEVNEMFIEGEFGEIASSLNETVIPALRVVFQCFEKKPQGKSIKACNLIDCSAKN